MMTKITQQCIGIDVAQKELVCSCAQRNESGAIKIIAHQTFANSEKGLKALVKWKKKLKEEALAIQFVMEVTGVYHQKAALFLHANGYDVALVLPNKAMHFQKTLDIKTITDKTSADALAQMGIEKQLSNWEPPLPVYNLLKKLSRERNQLVAERTAIKNELHAECAGAWANKNSIGRMNKRIALLRNQMTEIEKEMQEVVNTTPELKQKLKFVCSVPGVAFITAIAVVAETNGFHLIKNKRQLISYAGMDVIVKDSGTSVKSKARISKKGNKYLRKAIHLPALSAIRHDTKMKNIFVRLVSKHGIKMKAAVAVQRKLLEIIYTLWKKEELYDNEFKLKQDHHKNIGQATNELTLSKLVQ